MNDFLHTQLVFGPIRSRRLGNSLGINLLPFNKKICTFDCIYCECGWTDESYTNNYISLSDFYKIVEENLKKRKTNQVIIDSITFSGNGEPTLHPEFDKIIDATIELRQKYYPQTKISVLSNSTTLDNINVFNALKKVDNPIMKLDAISETLFEKINQPQIKISVKNIIENLKKFNGQLIIQTMLLKGTHNNNTVDNTTQNEIDKLIETINSINPHTWMIYSLDRQTPSSTIIKVDENEMLTIKNYINSKIKKDIKVLTF